MTQKAGLGNLVGRGLRMFLGLRPNMGFFAPGLIFTSLPTRRPTGRTTYEGVPLNDEENHDSCWVESGAEPRLAKSLRPRESGVVRGQCGDEGKPCCQGREPEQKDKEQEWEHLAAQKDRGGGQDHAGRCEPAGRVLGQAAPDFASVLVHPADRNFGHVAEVGPQASRAEGSRQGDSIVKGGANGGVPPCCFVGRARARKSCPQPAA